MGRHFNATLMDRNFRFRKPLVNPPGAESPLAPPAPQTPQTPQTPQAPRQMGIRDRVAEILGENPEMTRADVRSTIVEGGWDFKGKNPTSSVNMAFAALARGKKG